MRRANSLILFASCMLFGTLAASPGWSSHVFTDRVTGQITSTPISGEIEVDHRAYHVKAGSPADESLHGFSEGQTVELVLDGPAERSTSSVMKINLRSSP